MLSNGAIYRLPSFVPRVYANRGLTLRLVIEKMDILSPCLKKFIQAEKHLFEVDSRRAGKVVLQNRANSSKPTIAQNDARHRLNEKHAKARKAPVKFSGQEKSKKTDQETSSRTVDSGNFPPEITRAATGPLPVAAFSRAP